MLVLRVTAHGLCRAATDPAYADMPVFALFADDTLVAVASAMARAPINADRWIRNVYAASGAAVDVCVRKLLVALDEVEYAVAITPAHGTKNKGGVSTETAYEHEYLATDDDDDEEDEEEDTDDTVAPNTPTACEPRCVVKSHTLSEAWSWYDAHKPTVRTATPIMDTRPMMMMKNNAMMAMGDAAAMGWKRAASLVL